jgi:hypothetical protein
LQADSHSSSPLLHCRQIVTAHHHYCITGRKTDAFQEKDLPNPLENYNRLASSFSLLFDDFVPMAASTQKSVTTNSFDWNSQEKQKTTLDLECGQSLLYYCISFAFYRLHLFTT